MSGLSQVNHIDIRKHQTNNSTAKNAYQFSKTQRFPPPNPEYFSSYLGAKMHSTLTTANSPRGEPLFWDRPNDPISPKHLPVVLPPHHININQHSKKKIGANHSA